MFLWTQPTKLAIQPPVVAGDTERPKRSSRTYLVCQLFAVF
jgi:hypothetical protein